MISGDSSKELNPSKGEVVGRSQIDCRSKSGNETCDTEAKKDKLLQSRFKEITSQAEYRTLHLPQVAGNLSYTGT